MGERPRTYKTEGVILSRRNIGEADSILTVFARREGKFDGVARGVRKARSKMRGHLEPLTHTRMMLARGRSLDVFTQAETVTPFRSLRDDMERMAAAICCAELVDRFTLEHADHPGLFDLLLCTLDGLDAGCPIEMLRYFEVHLLAITGYDIQLDGCALCSARLPEDDTLLSPAAGGLVCRGCRAQAGAGRVLSPKAVKVLRYARGASFDAFAALRIEPDLAHALQIALADIVRYVLEREPLAGRYLEEVQRLDRASPAMSASRVQ